MTPTSLIQEKVRQAIGILKEFDIDCWITFARETALNGDPILDYLVNADLTWHSAIILCSSGHTCAIVGHYDKKMVEDTGAYAEVIAYVQGIHAPFVEKMLALNPRRIAVNYSKDSEICDGLTHGMYLALVDLLRDAGMNERLMQADAVISTLRQRKTPTELGFLKDAIRHTEEIFSMMAEYIRVGKTEQQIAEFMRQEVVKRKLDVAWDPTTCPAVFTGPDTAGAHYTPTGRVVKNGHVLNMDFGVRSRQYVSDLQRTFYVLEQGETGAPPDVKKGFETILRAIESARQSMKPGVQGITVDTVARRAITSAGYEEFPHALGHQVGRFAHDGTALLAPAWEKYAGKPFERLEQGMVFTIEPRLTVPGRGVVTIEEMVVVTDKGAEYLSTPQQELILIPPG